MKRRILSSDETISFEDYFYLPNASRLANICLLNLSVNRFHQKYQNLVTSEATSHRLSKSVNEDVEKINILRAISVLLTSDFRLPAGGPKVLS